jgi:hypothetical protein
MRLLRRARRALARAVRQPLLLSQVASSAAGAIAVFLAAAVMAPAQFLSFSLLNLIASTLVGLIRAALLQPALIQQRHDSDAVVPFRYAIAAAGIAGILLGSSVLVLGAGSWAAAGLIATSGVAPILHDWLRFRAISGDRRWFAAIGDLLRLALVPVALLFPHTAVGFQAWLGFSLLVPIVVLALRTPRLAAFSRYRTYRRSALLQLADFVLGQFVLTAPLLILGGLGTSGLVAGVRFAQTLLGPLNLAFAASTTGLIADAATRGTHAHEADLIRHGERLGRRLVLLAAGTVGVVLLVVLLTGFSLRGVGNPEMSAGLLLVGVTTVSSGWSGIHAILLRLLHLHGIATSGRGALVAVTISGFIVGYVAGGVDGSLIGGFSASAVASPLALGLPAILAFRRRRAADLE